MNLQEKILNIDELSNEELIELLIYTRKLCGYSAREFGRKANLSHATLLSIEQGGKMSHKSKKKIKDGIITSVTKYRESRRDMLSKETLTKTELKLDNELKVLEERIKYKKLLISKSNKLLEEIRIALFE